MKLYCPKCSEEIPAKNINVERMVAKCHVCDSIFSFADKFPKPNSLKIIDTPQPAHIYMDDTGNLLLRWSWLNKQIIPPTIFTFIWGALVSPIILGGLLAFLLGDWSEVVFFAAPLLAITLSLVYYLLVTYLNKTSVVVDDAHVSVKHGPLPWLRNKNIDATQVIQAYTKQVFPQRNRKVQYEVYVILKNGEHVQLLSGLNTPEHALFVEQEIEHTLGIEDQPVRGEYNRKMTHSGQTFLPK